MTTIPEFVSESGKKMFVVRALYRLKSSGAAFREFLTEALYDLGYKSPVARPDVSLSTDIKEEYNFQYWEYIIDVKTVYSLSKILRTVISAYATA